MKKEVIYIDKDAVFNETKLTCDYIAKKSSEEGKDYEHVRLTDANDEILERFFEEAKNTACDLLTDYCKDVGYVEEEDKPLRLAFDLLVSDLYDEHRSGAIESQLFLMMVYHMVSSWLSYCKVDKVAEYNEMITSASKSVLDNVRYRRRPMRKAVAPMIEVSSSKLEDIED